MFTVSLGLLAYEAIYGNDSPPDIRLEADSIAQGRNRYVVTFRAINEGGSTAAHVEVRGLFSVNGEVIELSETTLDYLPSHSEREGGLFFTRDPRKAQIELRAVGYERL